VSNLIPFRETTRIGFFYDIKESRKAGAPILKSIEANLDLKEYKEGGLLFGTEIYDREQCEAQALKKEERSWTRENTSAMNRTVRSTIEKIRVSRQVITF